MTSVAIFGGVGAFGGNRGRGCGRIRVFIRRLSGKPLAILAYELEELEADKRASAAVADCEACHKINAT